MIKCHRELDRKLNEIAGHSFRSDKWKIDALLALTVSAELKERICHTVKLLRGTS